MQRTLQIAGRRIDSDYELARVLHDRRRQVPARRAGSRAAFLRAAGTLRVGLRARPGPHRRSSGARSSTGDAARMALDAAVAIGSDYERARVLMAISERQPARPGHAADLHGRRHPHEVGLRARPRAHGSDGRGRS